MHDLSHLACDCDQATKLLRLHIKHIGREELCSDLQAHYMHYVPTDWHHCAQKGQGLVAIYSNIGYIGIAWLMGSPAFTLLPISEFSMYIEMPPMQVFAYTGIGWEAVTHIVYS